MAVSSAAISTTGRRYLQVGRLVVRSTDKKDEVGVESLELQVRDLLAPPVFVALGVFRSSSRSCRDWCEEESCSKGKTVDRADFLIFSSF